MSFWTAVALILNIGAMTLTVAVNIRYRQIKRLHRERIESLKDIHRSEMELVISRLQIQRLQENRMKKTDEELAIICHEINRTLCAHLGDMSQKPWADAEPWQRESAINGVRGVRASEITSHLQSHESWTKEKLKTGWKYGKVKDSIAKTHPCLVPFDELPPDQQVKDKLFFALASTL